jgi:hypothetical protein
MSETRTIGIITHEGPISFNNMKFGKLLMLAMGNVFDQLGIENIGDCLYSFTPYRLACDSLYLQAERRSLTAPDIQQGLKFRFGLDDNDDVFLITTVRQDGAAETSMIQLTDCEDEIDQLDQIAMTTAKVAN